MLLFNSMADTVPAPGQKAEPPAGSLSAETQVYKKAGNRELKLYLFLPPRSTPGQNRAAIIFFHGGGWRQGTPAQFEPQCRYFASRGMVAVTAEYRFAKDGGTIIECVADAKSAVWWLRLHAKEYGIDQNRIAAGGGSAGAHLAACTALLPDFNEKNEDTVVSSVPNALILFNPALDLTSKTTLGPHAQEIIKAVLGKHNTKDVSPQHHVRPNLPPTLILHGTDDKTIFYQQAMDFSEAMKKAGNTCMLLGAQGKGHGWFNYKVDDGFGTGTRNDFLETTLAVDEFLTSAGFLKHGRVE